MAKGQPLLGPGTRASSSQRIRWPRRRLLHAAFWAGLGAGTAGGIAALGRFLLSAQQTPPSGFVVVETGSLPLPGADPRFVPEAHCYLVNLLPEERVHAYPAFGPVAAEVGPGLAVLSHRCTHLGCHLPWRPDFAFEGERGWFLCPCHDATFTKAGQRVFGPAPRDMDQVEFTRKPNGSSVIHPANLHLGRDHIPAKPLAPSRPAAPRP